MFQKTGQEDLGAEAVRGTEVVRLCRLSFRSPSRRVLRAMRLRLVRVRPRRRLRVPLHRFGRVRTRVQQQGGAGEVEDSRSVP